MNIKIKAQQLHQELEHLLANEGLPITDLRNTNSTQLFEGHDAQDKLCGMIGVEVYPGTALLRSLVVTHDNRGSGYGEQLVKFAETWAQEQGVKTLYLLTTTAERFFSRLGYTNADRNSAPKAIAQSSQFSELCPQSAALMCKSLDSKNITRG